MDTMSINDLIAIALQQPIEEVGSLCLQSNRLGRVCESEMFWEERIKKDFPRYAPDQPLPRSLTYRRLYQMMWKIWNIHDGREHIFKEITGSGPSKNRIQGNMNIIHLIYPVPYFNREENHLKPDIVIVSQVFGGVKYFFVGYFQRRTITGDNIPMIGQDLPQETAQGIGYRDMALRREIQDYLDVNGAFYDGYFLIEDNKKNTTALEKELSKAGYLKFPANMLFPEDPDLFLTRQTGIMASKPALPQKIPSPPTPSSPRRNRFKEMFGFLSSGDNYGTK